MVKMGVTGDQSNLGKGCFAWIINDNDIADLGCALIDLLGQRGGVWIQSMLLFFGIAAPLMVSALDEMEAAEFMDLNWLFCFLTGH